MVVAMQWQLVKGQTHITRYSRRRRRRRRGAPGSIRHTHAHACGLLAAQVWGGRTEARGGGGGGYCMGIGDWGGKTKFAVQACQLRVRARGRRQLLHGLGANQVMASYLVRRGARACAGAGAWRLGLGSPCRCIAPRETWTQKCV